MASVKYDLPRLRKKILEDSEILAENKELIQKHDDVLLRNGTSPARRTKYLWLLSNIGRHVKKYFKDMTEDDITRYIEWVQSQSWKDSTKRDYLALMKTFLKTMNNGVMPDCIIGVKIKRVRGKEILHEQLLTEDDIRSLLSGCLNIRDKVVVSLLWETGARIDELLTMSICDIEEDPNGVRIRISGKTGPRKILLIESLPYLTSWLTNHPDRNNPKAPLFTNIGTRGTGNRMEYPSLCKMLKELGVRTGIEKPLNPHHFRHSRGTWMASRIPESPLKKYMGWTADSLQVATYVHLSGRDVDDSILKLHGLEDQRSMKSTMTPIACPRCESKNPPDASFCFRCSLNLKIDYKKELVKQEEEKTLQKRMEDMENRLLKMMYKANQDYYEDCGLDFDSFCDDVYWKLEDGNKGKSKGKRYFSDGPHHPPWDDEEDGLI